MHHHRNPVTAPRSPIILGLSLHWGYTLVFAVTLLFTAVMSVSIPKKPSFPRLDIGDQVMVFDNKIPGEINNSIYSTTGDGSRYLRLTDGSSLDRVPDISPDGEWVTFVSNRGGNDEIYIMRIDGSDARRLTNHPGIDSYPRFSNDGENNSVFSQIDQGALKFSPLLPMVLAIPSKLPLAMRMTLIPHSRRTVRQFILPPTERARCKFSRYR